MTNLKGTLNKYNIFNLPDKAVEYNYVPPQLPYYQWLLCNFSLQL